MASYYMLKFDCDNSIDIVEASNVVFDGENDNAEVGEKVTALYSFGKNKRNMYEAKVVNRSDDYDFLKEELQEKIASDERSESELGRGKRSKRKPADFDEEQTGEQAKKPKKKPSKLQLQKQHKITQQKMAAREIFTKIMKNYENESDQGLTEYLEPNVNTSILAENEKLKEENQKLKLENKRLRRERADALEVNKLLSTAVKLVDGLQATSTVLPVCKQTISPICNPPPSPSVNGTVADATSTSYEESESILKNYSNHFLLQDETSEETECQLEEPAELTQHLFRGTEESVDRLVQKRDVFALKTAKHGLENFAKNQTTLVRSALIAVFKEEALLTCSVKGGLAKGPLGKPLEKRQALNPEGVAAIIEFSNEVAKKHGWVVLPEKQLVAAMNTKLSELRAAAAKKNK